MIAPSAALAEAVRHIREIALREAIAMCNRLVSDESEAGKYQTAFGNQGELAFRMGHDHARRQLFHELEQMIAREAPVATVQPGYTSDGLEDG